MLRHFKPAKLLYKCFQLLHLPIRLPPKFSGQFGHASRHLVLAVFSLLWTATKKIRGSREGSFASESSNCSFSQPRPADLLSSPFHEPITKNFGTPRMAESALIELVRVSLFWGKLFAVFRGRPFSGWRLAKPLDRSEVISKRRHAA